MAQTRIIGGGVQVPGVELGVDPTFASARVSQRPLEFAQAGQVLGHYRATASTAAIAPAASSALFNFRWGDASRFCILQRLSVSVTVITAVTAQRTDPIFGIVQRAYTANETTNVTAVTVSGNTGKARTNMGSSLVSQIGVASAAAGISGGTKTGDGTGFSSAALTGLGALGTGLLTTELIVADPSTFHPIVFGPNEGFILTWGATALATGTVTVNVSLGWAEAVLY